MNKRSPLTADEPSHLVTADKNKPLAIIGTADLNVKINGYIIVQKFYVIQDLSHPCILGMDFLNDNRGLIRVADRVLDLHDGLIVVPLISREDNVNTLRLLKTVKIPAYTEKYAFVYTDGDPTMHTAITEPLPYMYDRLIGVARGIVQPKGRRTICRLLNLSSTPCTLPAGKAIAYLQELNMQDDFNVQALQRASSSNSTCKQCL